jgi:hypothetical protein
MSIDETQESTLPVLTILQRIKDGTVDPRALDRDTRLACVEAMLGEGISQAQIAVHLKRSDKTIQRDIQVIRQKNALVVTPEFVRETIGDMSCKFLMNINRLMQLSRSTNGSLGEKALAELYAAQVMKTYITTMQSLGCFPLKPQEIIGELFHHQAEEDQEASWQKIEEVIHDIALTTKGKKDAKSIEVKKDVARLRVNLEKTKLLAECKKVAKKTKEMKNNEDTEANRENA